MSFFPSIPGETPIDDVSGLKVKGITLRKELNDVEAENIRKAVVKYLASKPTRRSARFDLVWAMKLHREMFGDVWNWAGKPRTCNLNFGIDFLQVETTLHQVLADLKFRDMLPETDVLTEAVTLHHRAVNIHPFLNGNGRWSRLISNIWLKRHDHPIVRWPEQAVGEVSPVRQEYLDAIKAADGYDFGPLLALHRRFLEK